MTESQTRDPPVPASECWSTTTPGPAPGAFSTYCIKFVFAIRCLLDGLPILYLQNQNSPPASGVTC